MVEDAAGDTDDATHGFTRRWIGKQIEGEMVTEEEWEKSIVWDRNIVFSGSSRRAAISEAVEYTANCEHLDITNTMWQIRHGTENGNELFIFFYVSFYIYFTSTFLFVSLRGVVGYRAGLISRKYMIQLSMGNPEVTSSILVGGN